MAVFIKKELNKPERLHGNHELSDFVLPETSFVTSGESLFESNIEEDRRRSGGYSGGAPSDAVQRFRSNNPENAPTTLSTDEFARLMSLRGY